MTTKKHLYWTHLDKSLKMAKLTAQTGLQHTLCRKESSLSCQSLLSQWISRQEPFFDYCLFSKSLGLLANKSGERHETCLFLPSLIQAQWSSWFT
jgi:hypothetical protein